MRKIGIVGLGVIFQQHLKALEEVSDLFTVVMLYDKDPFKVTQALDLCRNIRGMEAAQGAGSLDDLLKTELDSVVVATPPASHYNIVECCMTAHKNVLLEKPADVSIQKLARLFDLADKQRCLLHVAFHAAYAADLLWFLQHRPAIENQFCLGQLRGIECRFSDPYVVDGVLTEGRDALGGSYLDSTVNELSVCAALVNLQDFHTDSFETKILSADNTSTVVASFLRLVNGRGFSISCHTDWTDGQNSKKTKLIYDDGFVLLNHSLQSVYVGNSNLLYDNSAYPRLIAQYVNLYRDYSLYLDRQKTNRKDSMAIHDCLLRDYLQ